jgi:hypothetical protein
VEQLLNCELRPAMERVNSTKIHCVREESHFTHGEGADREVAALVAARTERSCGPQTIELKMKNDFRPAARKRRLVGFSRVGISMRRG